MTIDTDLIVAGAGGGLCGALRAAQLGLDVLVVEASEHFRRGNNTSMSTAMIPGAGSRFQRAAGIEDSPARFLADIAAKTHGSAEPVASRALAEVSAELVEWLADYAGVPIGLPTDFGYPGHSVPRMHSVPSRHGAELLRHLLTAVAASDRVDMLVPARLADATPDGDGVTAVLERPDGARETIRARALLLATSGYGADRATVGEHLPEIAGAAYHGSEHARADALRIGAAHGAEVGYLDAYQGHAALSEHARTLVTWTTIMHGAILVNAAGRRFGDETVGYSEYAAALAAQPGAAGWIVLDQRIHDLSLAFTDYQHVVESGAVRAADSATELAAVMSVEPAALRAELAEAADVAAGRRQADRYGRTVFPAELRAPYRAVRVLPALFHTQGGLLVDSRARVRHRDGGTVPGLYAAGGAAAGISGHGADGYLAGNGLLPALGLSYLAASHLAGRHDSVHPDSRSGPS
ncbi:MAG TPA: FAD-binding protein [Trebonia sp.]|jgi:fumarate reductase flavoprotein subunit|nr:FAD-binding protein [Trebonia sp.]